MQLAWQRGVCVCVCAFAQWEVTTGTVSSRAIKAQETLRQRKDQQQRHPGTFCGQPNKNKSLYAHGRIIIARRRACGHHYAKGATSLSDTSTIPQKTLIPTCTKFTHPLVSVYPTDFTQLHTHHGWHFWSRFGFTNEIATILMRSPSNFHL